MVISTQEQLRIAALAIRQELEGNISGFPDNGCEDATRKLVEELCCVRIPCVYTPIGCISDGHVIGFHEPTQLYVDITPDQYSDQGGPINIFTATSPDTRYDFSERALRAWYADVLSFA